MKRTYLTLSLGFSLLFSIMLFTGCSNEETIKPLDNQGIDERDHHHFTVGTISKAFYGLSSLNTLTKYVVGPPIQVGETVDITGLGANETVLAIDFSAGGGGAEVGGVGVMYGVTNLNNVYIIDPNNGQSKLLSRTPFEPAINGATVGFDYDPSTNQLRLVTDLDQNIRLDANSGNVVAVDTDLNPTLNDINGIAYYQNRSGLSLYAIDAVSGSLMRQEPQNDGTLVRIGALGLVISGEGGFDMKQTNKNALAVLFGHSATGGSSLGDDLSVDANRVYEVSLLTGKATYRGLLDREIIGIAIP